VCVSEWCALTCLTDFTEVSQPPTPRLQTAQQQTAQEGTVRTAAHSTCPPHSTQSGTTHAQHTTHGTRHTAAVTVHVDKEL